jgi:hypothetical protein
METLKNSERFTAVKTASRFPLMAEAAELPALGIFCEILGRKH